MQHKNLNIWIETSSGAQHWRRAALGISLFSGVLTGLFGFALLFHTTSVPLALEGEMGAALTRKDAHSDLAHEFFGYISAPNHESVTYIRQSPIFSLTNHQQITEEREHIRLFSLFPRSYLASNGHIAVAKVMPYGLKLSQPTLGVEQGPLSHYENYIRLADTPVRLQNELTLNAWEGDGASSDAVFSGYGEEDAFISLLSSMKRPLITTKAFLSDGTEVKEIRASKQEVGIDTASGLTTYASGLPYLLATQNTQTLTFTIRNAPSEAAVATDPTLALDVATDACPIGDTVHFPRTLIHNLGTSSIVTNIVDKVSSSNLFTHLCIPVDNL